MKGSPYLGAPELSWPKITQQLVDKHPLDLETLRDAALTAWRTLWRTKIGTGSLAVKLTELRVPATIVGYFFEVILARELKHKDPNWHESQSKEEKDFVYVLDPSFSIELKTSGQAGL